MKTVRTVILGAVVFAVAAVIGCRPATSASPTAPAARTNYDGAWWLAQNPHRQFGWLTGYADCYGSERPANYEFWPEDPWYSQDPITDFYRRNPDRRGLSLSEVFSHLSAYPRRPQNTEAGQPVSGEFFDGLYWKQVIAGGFRDEPIGYVEGFIACDAALHPGRAPIFSRPAAFYAGSITRWYRLDPKTLDDDGQREPTAIRLVLFRFRDSAPGR